jgi:hypothetical protein
MGDRKTIFNEVFENREERDEKNFHANITLRMQDRSINSDNFIAVIFDEEDEDGKGLNTAISGNVLDLAMAIRRLMESLNECMKIQTCPAVKMEVAAIMWGILQTFMEGGN